MKKLIVITHDFKYTERVFQEFLASYDIQLYFKAFDWELMHTSFEKGDYIFFAYPQPRDFYELRYQMIKKFYNNSNLTVINAKTFIDFPIFNKLIQKEFFLENNITTAPYQYFTQLQQLLHKLPSFNYPFMIKKINGSRGKEIQMVTSQSQLLDYLSDKKINEFYMESYIESTFDIKAFVGRNNFYYIDIEPLDIPLPKALLSSIKKISQDIAKKCFLDYAGIDFRIKNNIPYVLEINRSPQLRITKLFLNEFIKILQ